MIYPFKKVIFNCKRATLLSIKKEQGSITPLERIQLRYHLFYCDPCRQFIGQWKQLDATGKALKENMFASPPFRLSDEARERMKEIIKTL